MSNVANLELKETSLREDVFMCFLCEGGECTEVYAATFRGDYEPGHVAITDHAYGSTGRLVCCDNCSMVTVHPRPSAEELVGLYQQLVDPSYQDEADGRRKSFHRIVGAIERLSSSSRRCLDVGAGTGMFVDVARRRGFSADGVEPSEWAVKAASDIYNVKLYEGVLPHPDIPQHDYDVVTMLDVIEHVDDPRELVNQAARVLSESGLLVVTTPDFGRLVPRLLAQRWWHCRLAHVQYFTESTLRRLLEDCGFTIEKTARYGWTFSLRYWISRLDGNPIVRCLLRALDSCRLGRWILNRRLRINFFDSVTVFARLSRKQT